MFELELDDWIINTQTQGKKRIISANSLVDVKADPLGRVFVSDKVTF